MDPWGETLPHPRRGLEDERGVTIGRYVVLDRLGEGGMGVVYAAYDPQLDRRVALKLLKESDNHDRLLREAQALARLSHPNVVPVHDAGESNGRVFVAMDYVAGRTLRDWLQERERSWREVVEVFVAAGRGLQAAHEAGLVHRDFKPENVLVREDGHVFVTDFGLARPAGAAPSTSSLSASPDLTLTGTLVGTPAYMAPEQHRGDEVDARSDQFGFCVALYEAVYRERPFASPGAGELTPLDALALEKLEGRVREAPAGSEVPAWLRRAVVRGLSSTPADRWPSLRELLTALSPRASRLPLVLAAAAFLSLGAGAMGMVLLGRGGADRTCSGAAAGLTGVWDADRRQAVRAAFLSTNKGYASATADRVLAALDAWTRTWTARAVDACEATAVRHEQSAATRDLRQRCLDDRLRELRALVGALSAIDERGLEGAPGAVRALADPAACDDLAALRDRPPPPADPALRARVEELADTAARVKAMSRLGRSREAMALGQGGLASARATAYAPVLAELLDETGAAAQASAEYATARPLFEEALLAAEDAHDDARRAHLWLWLAELGSEGADYAGAHRALDLAGAVIRRLGGEPRLQTDHLEKLARLLTLEGKYDEALEVDRRAVALAERTYGPDDLRTAHALLTESDVLDRLVRPAESIPLSQRGVAIYVKTLGADNPWTARALTHLAHDFAVAERFDEALDAQSRALASEEKSYAPDHVELGKTYMGLGIVLQAKTQWREAIPHLERALAIFEKAFGPKHPYVGSVLLRLADSYAHIDDVPATVPLLERALATAEGGPKAHYAEVAHFLADALNELHRDPARARGLMQASAAAGNPGAARWLADHPK